MWGGWIDHRGSYIVVKKGLLLTKQNITHIYSLNKCCLFWAFFFPRRCVILVYTPGLTKFLMLRLLSKRFWQAKLDWIDLYASYFFKFFLDVFEWLLISYCLWSMVFSMVLVSEYICSLVWLIFSKCSYLSSVHRVHWDWSKGWWGIGVRNLRSLDSWQSLSMVHL